MSAGNGLLFKSQRAVLVEESLGVLESALKLVFALVIQTTSGERAQRSVFYFQFLLLPPTLLEDGIEGWKDPVPQLSGLRWLVRCDPQSSSCCTCCGFSNCWFSGHRCRCCLFLSGLPGLADCSRGCGGDGSNARYCGGSSHRGGRAGIAG